MESNNSNPFARKYTSIKGISERRRLPLLGKIRLGIVKKNKSGNTPKCTHPITDYCDFCSHPEDVDYFIVPPDVERIYGKNPKQLEVMFPINDLSTIFPQSLRWWGYAGLKCEGNNDTATQYNEGAKEWQEIKCPCKHLKSPQNPKGECSKQGTLYFMLPNINAGGVYRITTGSSNTLIDISSGIDYAQELIHRFALIPMVLKREKRETTYTDGTGKQHKGIHYPLVVRLARLKSDTNKQLQEIPYNAEDIIKCNTENNIYLPKSAPDKLMIEASIDNPKKDDGAVILADEEKTESDNLPVEEITEKEPVINEPVSLNNDGEKLVTTAQRNKIFALLKKLHITNQAERKNIIKKYWNADSLTEMNVVESGEFITKLQDASDGLCDYKNGEFSYPPDQTEQ